MFDFMTWELLKVYSRIFVFKTNSRNNVKNKFREVETEGQLRDINDCSFKRWWELVTVVEW